MGTRRQVRSSTPSWGSEELFADRQVPASTAPSSPSRFERPQPLSPQLFPWEQEGWEPTPRARTPPTELTAFSVLGKRKQPSNSEVDRARPTQKRATASSNSAESSLNQMQLSLGQTVQTQCKECGMEYVLSSKEDRRLHDKYHRRKKYGHEVSDHFVLDTSRARLSQGQWFSDAVVYLDCYDKFHRKNHARAVLEIVQSELGAVPIPDADIWDGNYPLTLQGRPKYQVLMYIRGITCVGFLLIELIDRTYTVVAPPKQALSEQFVIESVRPDALRPEPTGSSANAGFGHRSANISPTELDSGFISMGISRIWTHKDYRNEHIASTLLDIAVARWNLEAHRDDEVAKSPLAYRDRTSLAKITSTERHLHVAFSQPTEAGTVLARKWFGMRYGWRVYVECESDQSRWPGLAAFRSTKLAQSRRKKGVT